MPSPACLQAPTLLATARQPGLRKYVRAGAAVDVGVLGGYRQQGTVGVLGLSAVSASGQSGQERARGPEVRAQGDGAASVEARAQNSGFSQLRSRESAPDRFVCVRACVRACVRVCVCVYLCSRVYFCAFEFIDGEMHSERAAIPDDI